MGIQQVDRLAVVEYGMPSIVLMENAARGVAGVAMRMLADRPRQSPAPLVCMLCGPGNNGGDGFALARFLHNQGCDITLIPLGEPAPGSDAAINRLICQRMKLPFVQLESAGALRDADLIVDAIFGTGLNRSPQGEAARAIEWINAAERPVLAVDLPSGMDCDTGKPLGPCVRADHTATMVGWKLGFQSIDAQKLLGELTVVDIGVPCELARRFARPAARSPARTPGRS